jgi:hypothetical protein
MNMSHRTVVSTFASPHEPPLKPKACKIAYFEVTILKNVLQMVHYIRSMGYYKGSIEKNGLK